MLRLTVPECAMVLAAIAALTADGLWMADLDLRSRRLICALISGLGCAFAGVWLLVLAPAADFAHGMLVLDPVVRIAKVALVGMTLLAALLAVDSDFTKNVGEFFALLLIGTTGMMFLAGARDLLMLFLALELTSLPLYVLAGFDKDQPRSAEAALKYFLLGGTSAALTLFGFSFLYGVSGTTELRALAEVLRGPGLDPLLALAIVMSLAGFGFKVAAVPFHLWAPDAYQGAPAPVAALIASGSKLAGFFILAVLVSAGLPQLSGSGALPGSQPGWAVVLAVLAVASMVLGNLAALVQTSLRRLLAYSAVAHAGYMLLGVIPNQITGLAPVLYYAITYALTTLGAFGAIAVLESCAVGDRFEDLAGLSRRSPLLAACLLIFMLSLAGIPPLAGFFGKFYVFAAALAAGPPRFGLLWLVMLALAASAVSLYYYLKVLKLVFVLPPREGSPLRVSGLTQLVLLIAAAAVVVLGCAPGLLIEPLLRYLSVNVSPL